MHGTSYLPPVVSIGDAGTPITSYKTETRLLSAYTQTPKPGVSTVVAKIGPMLALVHKNGEIKDGESKDKKNGASTLATLPFAAAFAAVLGSIFVL